MRLASVNTPCHRTLHGTSTAVPSTSTSSASTNGSSSLTASVESVRLAITIQQNAIATVRQLELNQLR